jgi:hypothetical protein
MTTTTRSAIGFVAAAALLLGACSSDKKTTPPATSSIPASTSSTAVSTTSTSAPRTSTTAPVSDVSIAVWPLASSPTRFTDPRAAARSFATDFLHMVAPVVGPFRQGDLRSGEVDVRKKAIGPTTTVFVRRLGTAGSWWVIGSSTPNIRITEPAALATIPSPVHLRGMSTAFEGTINISIRDDGGGTALAETFTNGGSNGTMGPFDTMVRFRRPTTPAGAIVIYTISSEDGHVAEGTVIRVRFSGT